MRARTIILAALLTIASATAAASAAATFQAAGQVWAGTGTPYDVNDSYDFPVGGGISYDSADPPVGGGAWISQFQMAAFSWVSGGTLHAHAFIHNHNELWLGYYQPSWTVGARAYAVGTYQMVVSGPAGPVSTSLNMILDGLTSATGTPAGGNTGLISSSSLQVVFKVNGGAPVAWGDESLSSTLGGAPVRSADGMLTNWYPMGGQITTQPFTVQANVPFLLEIQIQAGASGSGSFASQVPWTAEADSDFGNTLSFSTTRSVFNLPADYTANSADAGIVDNLFSVPEPATLSLLALGGLAVIRRRK